MITLASECLLFELANGESVPFSAEMISVEIIPYLYGHEIFVSCRKICSND